MRGSRSSKAGDINEPFASFFVDNLGRYFWPGSIRISIRYPSLEFRTWSIWDSKLEISEKPAYFKPKALATCSNSGKLNPDSVVEPDKRELNKLF